MPDINKINTNNTINKSQISILTSGRGGQIYHPVGFINISEIQNKYSTSFKNQPPGTGA